MAITKISNSNLYTDTYVVEDWKGGYKLEVDLSAESDAKDWKLNFDLDSSYSIRGAYGVDLVNNGSGNYTINGQGGWQSLEPGETAKAIFIIDDSGKDAIIPQFTSLMGSVISDP
ncbi:MAG: cellulose binding domain-containing protein, partial [Pleurocapsa sp.]